MDRRTRAEIKAAVGEKYTRTRAKKHAGGQVLVKADTAALADIDSLGYYIEKPIAISSYRVVHVPKGRTLDSAVEELSGIDGVYDVELDVATDSGTAPDDYYWTNGWTNPTTLVEYPSQERVYSTIDVADFWDLVERYKGPIAPSVVGVIDSGAYIDHEDLVGQLILPGYGAWNSSEDISPPFDAPNDVNRYHGTAMAGIIKAKRNNGVGVAGLGPLCQVYPMRDSSPDGGAYSSATVRALNRAVERGIRIVSYSSYLDYDSSIYGDAFANARANGVLTFACAGNAGDSRAYHPARYDFVVGVAGTGNSSFDVESVAIHPQSNYGPGIDFCAPYLSTVLRFPTADMDAWYQYVGGTSVSTPMLAALAGNILAINPDLTIDGMLDIMRRSCIAEIPRGGTRYGYGIPQFGKAIQLAIDSTHRSGFYSYQGYVSGLYKGGPSGEPIRIGAAYYGDADGTPRKFWAATM